jgi:hypothetical protein
MSVVNNLQIWGVVTAANVAQSNDLTSGAFVIDGGVAIKKNLNVGGDFRARATTPSTSVSTGAAVVDGGLGVALALNVGGAATLSGGVLTQSISKADPLLPLDICISQTGAVHVGAQDGSAAGSLSVGFNDASTTTGTGALVVKSGGLGVFGAANVGGVLKSWDTTASTDALTGSIVAAGGLGVSGRINAAGRVSVLDATASTSPSTGALVVSGGAGVGGALHVAGQVSVADATNSSSVSTGSVVTAGGLGVALDAYVGGILRVTDLTNATDLTTGALVVSGGVAIVKNVFIGGNLTVSGTTTSIDTSQTTIRDPFYGCGTGNAADVTDLGLWMRYVDVVGPTTKYAGLFRDVGTVGKPFTFFQECTDDFEGGGGGPATYVLADIVAKAAGFSGSLTVTDATASSSPSTGSIVTAGGLGVTGAVHVGGRLFAEDTTDATSVSDGSVVVSGGLSLAKSLFAGDRVIVASTANATSITDGALRVDGGISVADDIYSGGRFTSTDATASTSSTTGALVLAGGAGIGGDLHVAGSVVANNVTADSLTVNSLIVGSVATIIVDDNASAGAIKFDGAGDFAVASQPERYIYCNNTPTQGAVTVTLPAITASGQLVFVSKVGATNGGSSNVTITASGADKVDDASLTTLVLNQQYQRVTLVSFKPVSGDSVWLIQ